jgi:glycerophosphoryl diester phosphodiesterase
VRKNLLLLSFIVFFYGCKVSQPSTYIKEPKSSFEFFKVGSPQFPMVSVHRGGGEIENYPENCLESFSYFASKMPSIIECDIVMSKDSVLYMMHDNTLERTTTGTGNAFQQNWNYVSTLNVKDNFGNVTPYKVPTLDQTLLWGKNKVLFTLDVKRGTPFEKVIESVKRTKTENISVIITYNATDAKKVYDLNPNLLISVGIMKEEDYHRLRELGIPDKNMVAFIGTREPQKELIDFLHQKGILTILGVLGNLDKKAEAQGNNVYKKYIDLGVNILSTDRPEAVYSVIKP